MNSRGKILQALHRGDGVGFPLQALPYSPNSTELLHSESGCTTHVKTLGIRAKNEDLPIGKDIDLRRSNIVLLFFCVDILFHGMD